MKISEIKIGETYNGLTVLKDLGTNGRTHRYEVQCTCGRKYIKSAEFIGVTKKCRACENKNKIIDLTGQRFGKLVALEYVGRKRGHSFWRCKCDCGNESVVRYQLLAKGSTKSCGCLERENRIKNVMRSHAKHRVSASSAFFEKHGALYNHPLYHIWKGLFARCENPKSAHYRHYGGRGIKVCDRWRPENQGFENFVNDMGKRPSKKHSIDRIDVNGDYSPENCRWATDLQQANNMRRNRHIYLNGERFTPRELNLMLGIPYVRIIDGLRLGLDINCIIQNSKKYRSIKGNKKLVGKKFASKINHNRKITIDIDFLIEDSWHGKDY